MRALEFASGVQAECVGKPEAAFFNAVLKDMGCRPEETVMIGDVKIYYPPCSPCRKEIRCNSTILRIISIFQIVAHFASEIWNRFFFIRFRTTHNMPYQVSSSSLSHKQSIV